MSQTPASQINPEDLREVIDRLWDADAVIAVLYGRVQSLHHVEGYLSADASVELTRTLKVLCDLITFQVNKLDELATPAECVQRTPRSDAISNPASER